MQPSQLEQLCINLCSETMQHFYNTHTLKTAIETCRDEGISCGVEVDYADNAHCIDLISSLVSIIFICEKYDTMIISILFSADRAAEDA